MNKVNYKYTNDNTTIAAYRVFEVLKFLTQQPASVNDVIHYLESLPNSETTGFSKVVVYKYLTTLKFAGITLIRKKCQYEVENLPFKINLSEDILKALTILNNIVETVAEKYLSKEITDFFYQLKMRYALENSLFIKKNNSVKEHLNISKPTKSQATTIREYEDYCKDKFRLKITYLNLYDEIKSSIFEPLEVKFEDKKVMLYLFDIKSNTFAYFDSREILEIVQTPLKCTNKYFSCTTVFKLKDKLTKRYTLRNEEQSLGIDKKGELTVLNKKEPKRRLFFRLMRYGVNCEVCTSRQDRAEMLSMIENTLKNYEGT